LAAPALGVKPFGRHRSRRVYATVAGMTQPPPWNPTETASKTLLVILIVVAVFCVLPALVCGGFVMLGVFAS
jgi:hypothetical protein